MTLKIMHPTALVLVFIWIGFVCAISFMEAWLKFKAPGVTLALGLSIGRLVFSVLNKVEWVFAIGILCSLLLRGNRMSYFEWSTYFIFIAITILAVQTVWLLPALSERADKIIRGDFIESSPLHFCYVGMEIIKVVMLFVFGIKLFNQVN